MARRSKREKNVPVAVGLAGSGKMPKKAMKEHLSEYIEAQDSEILWVLPYTDSTTKPLQNVMDFLWDEDAKFALVSDGTAEDEELEDAAEYLIEADDAAETSVVAHLAEMAADKKALILLLNEDDDADTDLAADAAEKDIQTFDLCSGMNEIEVRDEDDVPEEEAEEEAAEEPEEAAEETEEEPGNEVVELDSTALSRVPESVMSLVVDDELDAAAGKLQAELSKNEIKTLADEVGLEIPKGQWAKTTAQQLVGIIADSGVEAPEVPDEAEVEAEVEASPEPPEEPVAARPPSPRRPPEEASNTAEDVPVKTNGYAPLRGRDVVDILAQITMAKGTAEAKKFYEFLTESELV